MAQPRNAAPGNYPAFPIGVNNTAKEEAMPRDQWGNVVTLREAVNVDIPPDGKPRRRAGYTSVQPGTLVHSAWSDDYLPWGLYVDGANLCVMHEDETVDVLRGDMALGLPVSCARINDGVWWSNGVQSGLLTLDLEQLPWSAGQPAGPPAVTGAPGGMLPAGTYQVTVTFIDASGRESGAPLAAIADVPADGALALSAIPQPPAGGKVRVYITEGQDGVLRAALTLPEGVTEYAVVNPAKGRTLDTLLLQPMPAGRLVAHGNGRLFVARGRELLF